MKILHTSDWHVGRHIARGQARDEEHRAVLAEIATIVRDDVVDLVLVAGDIFDSAAPTPAAEQIVYEALLAITSAGAQVVMVAGNHDNPRRLEAVTPLLSLAHVHTGSHLARAAEGGVIDVPVRTGETARIALVPWLSQKGIIRADELMSLEQAAQQGEYAARCQRILASLAETFTPATVNLILAHITITGAEIGGSERSAETIFNYWVPAQSLPSQAQYIALGHIHRAQKIPVQWPAWYSGSPLQMDFGEQPDGQCVLMFEASAGVPVGEVRRVALTSGRKLITLRGTLEAIRQHAFEHAGDDAYLRVVVAEPAHAGLAAEVRDLLPNAVEVRIEGAADAPTAESTRAGLAPRDLLAAYLATVKTEDPRIIALFDELMEDDHASAAS